MADAVDLEALCEVVVARDVAAAFPNLASDDEFVERLRASVTENLRALRDVLCGRLPLQAVRLTEPLVFAALQARLRIPQTSLQRSYRVGFVAMWQEWAQQLAASARDGDVPRDEAVSAMVTLTGVILEYQDHVASLVAESYARADDALSRSRAHVRQGLVRQILRDGEGLSPSDLLTLDYAMTSTHVAVLLPSVAEGAASQILPGLRAASRARQTLLYPVDLSSTVLWLGQPAGWTVGSRSALAERLAALDVEASVSDPLAGLDGFRATWQQVREVQQVRAAWGPHGSPRTLSHVDVSLEILLLRDPAGAAAFAAAELGPLAVDNDQARRLRATLEASFQWGSHVAAAEHLHLHEHTVRNRLAKAEEQLGRPLQHRRTELEVALRLIRLTTGDPAGHEPASRRSTS
jgi:sugar diacid utilization regulator